MGEIQCFHQEDSCSLNCEGIFSWIKGESENCYNHPPADPKKYSSIYIINFS